ncbi:hypothetical protein DMH01_12975 [Amycolatopsis sp. WAC 04182]|nr:hypothetical protein DMH01_12975 [Amycolatopsis sp. WAC 04182]
MAFRVRLRGKAKVECCESHFRNAEGCESGFRNVGGMGGRPGGDRSWARASSGTHPSREWLPVSPM